MNRLSLWIIPLLISMMAVLGSAQAAQTPLLDTGKVNAGLISSHDQIAPGETFSIALLTELDPGWHTYWRNPGDSGEPVHIEWIVPDGISIGDIYWPLPSPIATGPIINYGFEDTPLFPVDVTLSADMPRTGDITLLANIYYLVCKDVCIPEDGQLSLTLSLGEPIIDTVSTAAITQAKTATPKLGNIRGGIMKSGDDVSLSFTDLPTEADLSDAYFFPFDQGVLGHSEPQALQQGEDGISLTTRADYAWDEALPDQFVGVLKYRHNGEEVGTELALNVGTSVDIGTPIGTNSATNSPAPSQAGSITFITAMIGALIGGLILNLMPCVFPVISIKALSIAKTAHGERAVIRRDAWAYTLGVIATFLILTLILLAVKAGGSEIGWGFQLQSPQLVAALALLLFAVGLNLLGVFEIGTGLQNTGGTLAMKDGPIGAFFTGALAVIVATPCTAPFMAGALGYALSQTALVTLCVFMGLAIGFAAPFLLIAYMPSLLQALPKPGPWMVRFREFLSFPMFGAAIWLVWVLVQQSGQTGLLLILLAMLALAFGIWSFKNKSRLSKLVGSAALLCALFLPFTLSSASAPSTHSANIQTWSPEAVAAARAEGQNVFVDFTAAWCVTCKVNELTVLSRPDVQAVFAATNTAIFEADWTNKNDIIANELAKHGRSGVPLYLVYGPGQNSVKPVILPQILTKSVIEDAIMAVQSK